MHKVRVHKFASKYFFLLSQNNKVMRYEHFQLGIQLQLHMD